jgi:hypothetical protein
VPATPTRRAGSGPVPGEAVPREVEVGWQYSLEVWAPRGRAGRGRPGGEVVRLVEVHPATVCVGPGRPANVERPGRRRDIPNERRTDPETDGAAWSSVAASRLMMAATATSTNRPDAWVSRISTPACTPCWTTTAGTSPQLAAHLDTTPWAVRRAITDHQVRQLGPPLKKRADPTKRAGYASDREFCAFQPRCAEWVHPRVPRSRSITNPTSQGFRARQAACHPPNPRHRTHRRGNLANADTPPSCDKCSERAGYAKLPSPSRRLR